MLKWCLRNRVQNSKGRMMNDFGKIGSVLQLESRLGRCFLQKEGRKK